MKGDIKEEIKLQDQYDAVEVPRGQLKRGARDVPIPKTTAGTACKLRSIQSGIRNNCGVWVDEDGSPDDEGEEEVGRIKEGARSMSDHYGSLQYSVKRKE
jgi:hypothetical protein